MTPLLLHVSPSLPIIAKVTFLKYKFDWSFFWICPSSAGKKEKAQRKHLHITIFLGQLLPAFPAVSSTTPLVYPHKICCRSPNMT